MSNKALVLETMKKYGKVAAEALQSQSAEMTATQIVADEDFIPLFSAACSNANMLTRPAGFLVKTALDNVCKLLIPYDSDIYTDAPEQFPSMWGFQWSTDPEKAKDFIALSTSPYMIGDCCLGSDDVTYCSIIDNNVFDPVSNRLYWTAIIEDTTPSIT